ncbi:MAG: aminotransferase class V-fold PLP-dependent enzyme [Hyphomicrobiales bacterium]|nr:aminotransferase class V-fold PLP-dependent enzyme [Hyphomicrobiales bacterium]
MRGLALRPGDEILTTSHVCNAVRSTLRFVSDTQGVVAHEVALPMPVTEDAQIVETVRAGLTSRTRLIVVDHVPSAMTFPVKQIVALAHAQGVPVLVDGAHAPGLFSSTSMPSVPTGMSATVTNGCVRPRALPSSPSATGLTIRSIR